MSNKKILICMLGLLSVMFISLATVTNANAEESKVTIKITRDSNNQENGNSKNEKVSHQKENTSKKLKQKHILRLPKTGEINSFGYILLGIILLGMDLLYIIIKRNGEIQYEKN
ncbi:hypothetical protein CUM91_15050 [Enterococcus faecalis]|uniref:LPXTG cell wall anchor domain-containing protein n=1 Tax=Enterococcus faecalis TaxID=1351 RepID=UPI000CF6F943|nr:LPXTG cell wall anchor domain-containing protein [Enterococcus faecalis]PQC08520.1 hypothetical protein CUM91_15050 [Enterococcus faecalis]